MVSFETKDELRPKECQETRTYCTGHKIVLRGKNAWPRFQRFRPYYFPWYVDDETDQAHLLEGLEACLHVASMLDDVPPEALGLTDGAPFHRKIPLLTKSTGGFTWEWVALPKPAPIVYPSPEIHDDLALARLARSAKRGGEWACDIFLHVEPMTNEETEADEEPESAPFYAFLLIILDPKTGMILSLQKADDPEDYTEIFTRAALACAQSQGKPSRVLVCNERTRAFFGKISAQLRAELVYKKRIPCLEEALDEFLAQFTCDEEGSDEDVEQLLEALRDPRALADMPESILIQLRQLIKINEMPEDIAENVMRECKRRGLL